jgi:hypothetical protein
MDHAVSCLEREFATLAHNFGLTADALVTGQAVDLVDPEHQQDLRWEQMVDLRKAIGHLRSRVTYEREVRDQGLAQSAQYLGAATNQAGRYGQVG